MRRVSISSQLTWSGRLRRSKMMDNIPGSKLYIDEIQNGVHGNNSVKFIKGKLLIDKFN